MKRGDRVESIESTLTGIVFTVKRSGDYPIGVIMDQKTTHDFLGSESWVPPGKKDYAWIGHESELRLLPPSTVEALYKSILNTRIENKEGYYKKDGII